MSDTTANIINPFKDKKFFYIQTSEGLFKDYAEAYEDRTYIYNVIPFIEGIGEADYIVYGDTNMVQLFATMHLVKASPIPSDIGPELLDLMPVGDYYMDCYNNAINFKTGKYILLKMTNAGSHFLTNKFIYSISTGQNMIGFDAELFAQSK